MSVTPLTVLARQSHTLTVGCVYKLSALFYWGPVVQYVSSQCPDVSYSAQEFAWEWGKGKSVCGGSLGPFKPHVPKAVKIGFLWSTVKERAVSYKSLNSQS